MMQVHWRLKSYLEAHGLTAYRLAKVLPHVRQPTVYRLASDRAPQSVNLELLGQILHGLSTLTGETVRLDDVMEVVEVQVPVTDPEVRPAFDVASIQPFARRTSLAPLGSPIDTTALAAEIRGR